MRPLMLSLAVAAAAALALSCGNPPDTCRAAQCFRNIRCVTSCGGSVVSDGCCSCTAGSFDEQVNCLPDGGSRDGG